MATATTKESKDFYTSMPEWQQQQLVGDAAWESQYRDAMSKIASQATGAPRPIAGLGGRETGAMSAQDAATNRLTSQMEGVSKTMESVNAAKNLGAIKDPTGMGNVYQLGGFNRTDAPSGAFNTITGPDAANVDALRGKYQSGYTDDVVDTTLAGMQRQAQRDQLARDARGAAIGGTSNSRSAVADAVSGQLTGMNMAQMESQLRDKAFNTAAGYGLQEADMANKFGLDSAQFAASQAELKRKYGLDLANFGLSQEMAASDYELNRAQQSLAEQKARADNSLAMSGFSLDEAMAQAAQGNAAAKLALDKAGMRMDMIGTTYGAQTDRAKAMAGLGAAEREIQQKRNDAKYYGGMEAGSWLADVYSGSRTRDSAPYNYVGEAKSEEKGDKPDKWQQVLSGVTAGLSGFL